MYRKCLLLSLALGAFASTSTQAAIVKLDFGTGATNVETGYSQFVVSEGAMDTISGYTFTLQSRDADIVASNKSLAGAAAPQDLNYDYAATTFNGVGGNYISILITGLPDGTLDFTAYFDYNSGFNLPQDVLFGVQGETLDLIADNAFRGTSVSTGSPINITAGETYELRILEQGNANLAYISGLDLDVVPIPEPTSTALIGLAGLSLILRRKR
ncbi:hypothetical protein Rhal01_02087 [Rubritalea halochordaticola]|uniref:PEP-CTERM sorting domain-containing protein n=1 Tax=Rubritalea halochordaticola TaxID=714537 RepID=A0ABP9V499_9BACT